MPYRFSVLASAICCVLSVSQSYAVENQANMNEKSNNEVNNSDKSQSTVSKMTPIVVYASTASEVGQSIYNQKQIQNVPNTKKTLTDFLKVNPNVQFGNASLASGQQGELDASDISINGALFYENKFLLNNVNIGNSLNPASGSTDNTVDGLAGSSLNANINMDLICELEVLDSNVSAEYGEFTGGVVKAKTCAPKTEIGQVHGKISYDFTSSDWTQFNYISPEEQEIQENFRREEERLNEMKRSMIGIGMANNYWYSFFNMISKNIDNLRKIKKETDDILYSMYSA